MDYPKQKLSKYQVEEIKEFNNNIKVAKIDSFKYSYEYEVKSVLNIYKKFCINFKIRKMIKKINPNLEETIIKIVKKLKSFKNK